jgi:membrane associated rhomboid family serine protease
MFLHAGLLHLLGNMLILYLAAPFIEDVWGRLVFGAFYLLSGLAAAGAHIASAPESTVPMLGASGAIAGVMGAFLVRYGSSRIEFFYMIGFLARGTFWAPAWLMLPLWLVEQVLLGLMTSSLGVQGGVAYWAHVGGFVFGGLVAGCIKAGRVEERFLAPALEEKSSPTLQRTDPRLDEAHAAREAGDARRAWTLLSEVLTDNPRDRDACLTLWDVALQRGWTAQAAPAMLQALRLELNKGETELAVEHWQELVEHVPSPPAEAALIARLVPALVAEGHPDHAVHAGRALLEAGAARVPTAQVLRVARALRGADPQTAAACARLTLDRADLHQSERLDAERMIGVAETVTHR